MGEERCKEVLMQVAKDYMKGSIAISEMYNRRDEIEPRFVAKRMKRTKDEVAEKPKGEVAKKPKGEVAKKPAAKEEEVDSPKAPEHMSRLGPIAAGFDCRFEEVE